jgi:hypothetical protein
VDEHKNRTTLCLRGVECGAVKGFEFSGTGGCGEDNSGDDGNSAEE